MAPRREQRKRDDAFFSTFSPEDTRHYGVFVCGLPEQRHLEIDLPRYGEFFELIGSMKAGETTRNGALFIPAKRCYLDYQINLVSSTISDIRTEWADNKAIIDTALARIKGKRYEPYDDDLAACGILEFDEAQLNNSIKTMFSEQRAISRQFKLFSSLYAQFFHQMASQIEALTIKMLANAGYDQDHFSRTVLYTFSGHTEETVSRIEGFPEYDKLCSIWNFIKHNNTSVYQKVKEKHPDTVIDHPYTQGDIACFYVKFSGDLVTSVLHGVEVFLRGYCRDVLSEKEDEAIWNHDEYFWSQLEDMIQSVANPLGLSDWI